MFEQPQPNLIPAFSPLDVVTRKQDYNDGIPKLYNTVPYHLDFTTLQSVVSKSGSLTIAGALTVHVTRISGLTIYSRC